MATKVKKAKPGTIPLLADREYDVGRPGQHNEVIESSESEPALEQHVATVSSHAAELEKHWRERVAREGKKVWINPLAPKDQQVHHPTKASAQKEIDTQYQMQVEQAKLTKMPKGKYTPQPILLEPKRTLEDFMGPKAAAMTRAAKEIAANVQNLGSLARQLSGRALTASQLSVMVEATAVARVGELSDEELKNCVHRANFGGKLKLAKAAKAECKRRNVSVLI